MALTRLKLSIMSFPGGGKALSLVTGIAAPHISEYATGRMKIPPRHLILLSDALNCNPTDLLGDVDDEEIAL